MNIEQKMIELSYRLIDKDGMELKHILEEYKSYSLCRNAVSQNGLALQYVPLERFPKQGLSEIAVSNNPMALRYVPEEDKTDKLCRTAVSKFIDIHTCLNRKKLPMISRLELVELVSFIPDKYKTIHFYFDLIKYNPFIISDVPDNIMDKRLSLEAIIYSPRAYLYIPIEHTLDINICIAAINSAHKKYHHDTPEYWEIYNKIPKACIYEVDEYIKKYIAPQVKLRSDEYIDKCEKYKQEFIDFINKREQREENNKYE